jgi:hypothetical protein
MWCQIKTKEYEVAKRYYFVVEFCVLFELFLVQIEDFLSIFRLRLINNRLFCLVDDFYCESREKKNLLSGVGCMNSYRRYFRLLFTQKAPN